MTSQINLYDYVLASLRAKVIPQRQVANESGVPFSTVAKIAQGSVTEPSVHTVQKLYDYFRAREGEHVPRSKPRPLPACGQGAKSECLTVGLESTGAAVGLGGAGQGAAMKTDAGDVREVA